jgi:hypothetical protein
MIRHFLTALMVGWCLALTPSPSQAASFDPDLDWRTLETPHFNITFHQGEAALAEETAAIAEAVWDKMTAEIGTAPRRPTELVLIDPTDLANGYAMSLPVNTIVIFITSPSEDSALSLYSKWTDTILTHEFAHTLHLDTIEGLPKVLRAVLGRVVNINRVSPGWVIEGFATFQETRHTTGGRGRSNMAHMVKRMAVLEDQFPPLGNMDGFQTAPPGGNLRYLFGQDLIQFVSDKTGSNTWTKWIHAYGGSVPYWLPSQRVFGQRLVPLYKEWKLHLSERYGAQAEAVRATGETETALISDGIAACMGPTWNPTGDQLVFSCAHPVDGSSIQLWKPESDETEVELKGAFAKDFSWRADGKAFFYSGTHTVDRFNLFDDVYFHKLGRKSSSLLTRGKRARQPSLSPDGRDLIVVRNKLQENWLAKLSIDQTMEPLAKFERNAQLATPVHSPDGRHIALSMWLDGVRDIWILKQDGSLFRRVTIDGAHDMDPAWSADGRWLYFSSDRTGIFNIYGIELETERLFQVTNVLGGAFHPAPSPDGQTLIFESFSHNGMDIVSKSNGRDLWTDRGFLPQPLEHAGALSATQDLSEDPSPPPTTAAPIEASAKLGTSALPSGIPRPVMSLKIPGLSGFGGPMGGFDVLPIFGNPYPDSPESGPDVEDGAVDTEDEIDEEEDFPFSYPVKRYRPGRLLFPPRYLMPGAMVDYSDTLMAFVGTSSWDPLMQWFYTGFLSYRGDNNYIGWGASVAYNRWIPVISGGVYSQTVRYGNLFENIGPPGSGGSWVRSIERLEETYFDKRTKGYLSVAFPTKEHSAAYVQWRGTHRTPLTPLSHYEARGIDIYRPNLPTRGFQSAIGAGWGYGKGVSYGRAISTEKGQAYGVSSRLTSSMLGSYQLDENDVRIPFSQFQFGGNYRKYLTVPWFDDHVVATSLAAGGTIGDRTRYGSYRLGGNFGQGGIYSLPEEYRSLRGFRPAAVYGDWYYLATMEYRLPLWWIDRGVGTIPFFARYIAATAFLDAGNAFNDLPDGNAEQAPPFQQTLVGAGAEIRARAIIGYGINAVARLGYGFALRGPGIPIGSAEGLYIRFDTGF